MVQWQQEERKHLFRAGTGWDRFGQIDVESRILESGWEHS